MARAIKRLAQTALSTTVANRVTVSGSAIAQITQLFLANNGSTMRVVTLYHGGLADANRLVNGIEVAAGGSVVIDDLKVVVTSTLALAAKQDAGTDIILTAFGIEEV